MSLKIITACAALAALAAAAPATALASPELQTSAGTKVAVGTGIKVKNEWPVVYTTAGIIEKKCGPASLTGTVQTNSGSLVELKIESFKLEGGLCASFTFENLPWCLSSSVVGEWVMKGGGCEKENVPLAYSYGSCKYQLSTMIGSYSWKTSPLSMLTEGQTWISVSGMLCASPTVFDWSLTLVTSSEGELKIV